MITFVGGVVGSGCLLAWCAAQVTRVLIIDSMDSVAPIFHQSFFSFCASCSAFSDLKVGVRRGTSHEPLPLTAGTIV